MDFFEIYQQADQDGFWTYCEAENEETEIPNIQGSVSVQTSHFNEARPVYLRLINSLLTFSNDAEDALFRGYADIRYYAMSKFS